MSPLIPIGVFVSIPILWVIYRAFRGLRGAEANFWAALPSAAQSGFQLVFALPQPLDEREPAADDFSAISVTVPGQRAGLVLNPGKYWLYAVPTDGHLGETEALAAATRSLRERRAAVVAFDNLPVVVS